MSWTKRQLLDAAYEEIGLADYLYGTTAGETTTALSRLDSMMATWDIAGIRLGYNMGDPQTISPTDESGVPDWANEAIYLNLAIRLAAGFGKQVSRTTVVAAKMAYDAVRTRCSADIPRMQKRGNLPTGAGWKSRDRPFIAPPTDQLTAGPDSLLEFNGPVPV